MIQLAASVAMNMHCMMSDQRRLLWKTEAEEATRMKAYPERETSMQDHANTQEEDLHTTSLEATLLDSFSFFIILLLSY